MPQSSFLNSFLPIGDGKDAIRRIVQFIKALDNFMANVGCTAYLPAATSPDDFFADGFNEIWPEYCDALWVCLDDGSVWGAFNNDGYVEDGPAWKLVASSTATSNDLIGAVRDYAGSAVPSGYLECNGAAISRSVYAALFAAIGTTYGVGNGSTTFNIPDMRGRASIGEGTGSGLTARSLGDSGGEETHTLSIAELAAHTHAFDTKASGGTTVQPAQGSGAITAGATASRGSDTPHNNMQPFVALKKIIYAGV